MMDKLYPQVAARGGEGHGGLPLTCACCASKVSALLMGGSSPVAGAANLLTGHMNLFLGAVVPGGPPLHL